jgi:hypothetical protein
MVSSRTTAERNHRVISLIQMLVCRGSADIIRRSAVAPDDRSLLRAWCSSGSKLIAHYGPVEAGQCSFSDRVVLSGRPIAEVPQRHQLVQKPKQPKKKNDRERYAEQPKKSALAHVLVLLRSELWSNIEGPLPVPHNLRFPGPQNPPVRGSSTGFEGANVRISTKRPFRKWLSDWSRT